MTTAQKDRATSGEQFQESLSDTPARAGQPPVYPESRAQPMPPTTNPDRFHSLALDAFRLALCLRLSFRSFHIRRYRHEDRLSLV